MNYFNIYTTFLIALSLQIERFVNEAVSIWTRKLEFLGE